jgi:methylated-DNA-[protein]-cysteine S-methyltransferase
MTYWTVYESPIGPLTLIGQSGRLTGICFPNRAPALPQAGHRPEAFTAAVEQLDQYFAGERRTFELELELGGTPFQRAVWQQLLAIPYGDTVAYGEVAKRIGRPDRARAVGAAVGATPVPIVVPCHRAVGADGSLTGYGGGLERKRALLDLEQGVGQLAPL